MFLNSNFIKKIRDIIDDFHYHLDNLKIRENIIEIRQMFFEKN